MDSGGVFHSIAREPRLSDRVADAIRERILTERLQPGDALPSERELAKQFGVSRTVIREAIRTLDAKGLLEVRTGSGVRIVAVDSDTVRESIRHFVQAAVPDARQVAEVRAALEVAAAGLAAERAGAEDLASLGAAVDRFARSLADVEAATQADLAFHRAIAAATRNELFLLLHDSIGDALVTSRRDSLRAGREERVLVLEAHRRIRDAVAAHDRPAAEAAMREHLDRLATARQGA
jgi:GntR family transcriptional regulator, transcriptional repressor for pyruvate dehydrogenase complex